jgi:hypothetical protein
VTIAVSNSPNKSEPHALAARTERLDPVRVKNAIACGKALSVLRELLGHGE